MNTLKIACLELDTKWEAPAENRKRIAEIIREAAKADIYILPETFTTGFSIKREMAETMTGETLQWLKNLAADLGAGLLGSLVIEENNLVYNRMLLVEPSGNIQVYDKQHLFNYGSEGKHFTAGKAPVIFNYKNWKIKPIICYDLRFPVAIRNVEDYDVLICVANWPDSRIEAWDTLLKARAIENQCYVAGVNRIGTDGNNLNYCGHSQIIDPMGEVLAKNIKDNPIFMSTLEKSFIETIRAKLPFLEDRDDFKLL